MLFAVEIISWPSETAEGHDRLSKLFDRLMNKLDIREQFVVDTQNPNENEFFRILDVFDKQEEVLYRIVRKKYPEDSINLIYYAEFYSSRNVSQNLYSTDSKHELEYYLISIFNALEDGEIDFNDETHNRYVIDINAFYEVFNEDGGILTPTILNFEVVIRPADLF